MKNSGVWNPTPRDLNVCLAFSLGSEARIQPNTWVEVVGAFGSDVATEVEHAGREYLPPIRDVPEVVPKRNRPNLRPVARGRAGEIV